MTAEIALINSSGIALAADSAVTIGNEKAYTHAHKIFELSRTQPIGIMIYDNAEFGTLQFEVIVKEFRRRVASKNKFPTVEACQQAFVKFLNMPRYKRYLQGYGNSGLENRTLLTGFLLELISPDFIFDSQQQITRQTIIKKVDEKLKFEQATNKSEKLNTGSFRSFEQKLKKADVDHDILASLDYVITKVYGENLLEIVRSRLEEIKRFTLMKSVSKKITELYFFLASRKMRSRRSTGYFLCGFGDHDYFPSYFHGILDGLHRNQLRHWTISSELGLEPYTTLIPMAQKDLTEAFMFGAEQNWLSELTSSVNTIVQKVFEFFDPKNKISLSQKNAVLTDLTDVWHSQISFVRQQYSSPIMKNLMTLPKEEMALLADALVELTSVKRRFDSKLQTVGGPIDVAIITKGDGFIWSKRKHYFSPQLNPSWYNRQEFE